MEYLPGASIRAVSRQAGSLSPEQALGIMRGALSGPAVQEPGKSPGGGPQPPDRMGSIQFWMFWDGSQLHKGLRRWNGSTWAVSVDDAASSLTGELRTHSAAFHSGDVRPGTTFAVVTADSTGCAALGLDNQGRPVSGF
jgi:hypothetical protein